MESVKLENKSLINQNNEMLAKAKLKINLLRQKKKNLKIQLKATALDEE